MSTPTHQKALVVPQKQAQFVVDTTEVKKPGPDQILIKVEATALNPADWKIQTLGVLLEKFPAVLGFDASGTVVEVGQNVTSLTVGDRVLVQGWRDISTQEMYGTFLQYHVSAARFAAKIPDSLTFEAAATLPSGLATAAFPLYNQADEAPSAKLLPPWVEGGRGKYAGKPFLVIGGATSMGQVVIQYARLSGFSPIITTSSLHNADFLKSLGATHVVDRKLSDEDVTAAATAISGGLFQYVYDAAGEPETFPLGYNLTAPLGYCLTVDPFHAKPEDESGRTVYAASGWMSNPINHAIGESLVGALPKLLEAGDIKPNRQEVLPGGLGAILGGLDRLKKGQVSGVKLVVRPHETP